jgi:HNH endonuclease
MSVKRRSTCMYCGLKAGPGEHFTGCPNTGQIYLVADDKSKPTKVGLCFYCGCDGVEITKDHKVPKSMVPPGGLGPGNIVPACAICNNKKGAFTAEEFRDWLATPSGHHWLGLLYQRRRRDKSVTVPA